MKDLMHLWTDDAISEFAIIYNSRVMIRTKESVQFTKKIDESPYIEGYALNWGHTLSQWVVFYLANKYAKILLGSDHGKNEFRLELDPKSPEIDTEVDNRLSWSYQPKIKSKIKTIRQKAVLKCHFCNLKYCLEEERKDHEEFWHNEKLKLIK
jgi:hypothetical protein